MRAKIFFLIATAALGCDTAKSLRRTGPDSVQITIRSPAALGDEDHPIAERQLVVDVDVLDVRGDLVTDDVSLNVYAQYLGTLTPSRDANTAPLMVIDTRGGSAHDVRIAIPSSYGPTVLWMEDTGADRKSGSFATGSSVPIFYPNPTIADVNHPPDEMGMDRNERSTLETKQVRIVAGTGNKLVVTATYTQSYNVSEVRPDGTMPDFGHLYVYSFQRPPVMEGDVLDYVTGAVTEFNGQTEISFPLAEKSGENVAVPAPIPVDGATIKDTLAMEKLEGALVKLSNAKVCATDSNYEQRQQWTLDIGNGCDAKSFLMNIVTFGAVQNYDPPPQPGTTLGCVIGTVRNVAIGSFILWILYPRHDTDMIATGACP